MQEDLIITGGTGMVGSAFKSVCPLSKYPGRAELKSMSFDVENKKIIHLAAKVGGIRANMTQMAEFYYENSLLNQKILHHSYENSAKKVISLLSTCIYPSKNFVKYPLTEDQLHKGPPHSSNYGYAYSKRMVDVMSRAYRKQYGCNFITAVPNNLFGENDNFDLEDGHVIPALIRKVWEAKINKKASIQCWGDGTPLREFTYSGDIVKILLFLMENYDGEDPVNIGNTKEFSIKEVVNSICQIMEYDGKIEWQTNRPNGQHRKPSDNNKLVNLGWDVKNYTPFHEALKKTCNWFILKYPQVRGVEK